MIFLIALCAVLANAFVNGGRGHDLEVAQDKAAHFAKKAKAAIAASSTERFVPADIRVQPSGYLADTPEVAAAKNAFLSEQHNAAHVTGNVNPDSSAFNFDNFRASYFAAPYPYASYSIDNGYLADTPEIAAAKAAHLAEQAKAAYAAGATPSAYIPGATPVQANGYLSDTPEVAAAKASFFAEFAKASSSSAGSNPFYSPYYTWNGYAWVANQ